MAQVELPDGRVLVFGDVPVVGFNLAEAGRHARRGARTRQQAVADVYPRPNGVWGIGDPSKELEVVSDLAAAVLFSYAALEGAGACERVPMLQRLHDGLAHPRRGFRDERIFGQLLRGDADSCADDALAL